MSEMLKGHYVVGGGKAAIGTRQNSQSIPTSQLDFRSEWRISEAQGYSVESSFRKVINAKPRS